MLSVEGIYQNGELILNEKVDFIQAVKVVVVFLEEPKMDDVIIIKTLMINWQLEE